MDNYFKDKLKQYRVEWDKDQLWEELEPKLPKPSTRFWNYWWALLPLLLIPTCWGQLSQLETSAIAAEQTAEGENKAQNLTMVPNEQLLPIITLEEASLETVADTEQAPQRPEAGVQIEEVSTTAGSTSLVAPASAVSIRKGAPHAGQRRANSSVVVLPPATKKIKRLTTFQQNAAGESANARSLPTTAVVADRAVQPIEKLLLQRIDSRVKTKNPNQSSPPSIEPIAKTLQTKGLFVNVLGGVGTLQRKVDFATLEPVDVEPASIHKNREVPQFAWNGQVELGYRHRSGWKLSGGLGHNQLHEQFSYDAVLRADTIVETSNRARYFVKSDGDTLFLSGSVVSTELETRRIRYNNRLAYYQIPLSLGYYYPKGRLGVEVVAGVNYLFQQQYRGRISEGEPVEIVDDPGFTLKSHWGCHLRLGVQYQLFNTTNLYLGGQYYHTPEFVRGEIGQRYSSYGLQVGMQYRL